MFMIYQTISQKFGIKHININICIKWEDINISIKWGI